MNDIVLPQISFVLGPAEADRLTGFHGIGVACDAFDRIVGDVQRMPGGAARAIVTYHYDGTSRALNPTLLYRIERGLGRFPRTPFQSQPLFGHPQVGHFWHLAESGGNAPHLPAPVSPKIALVIGDAEARFFTRTALTRDNRLVQCIIDSILAAAKLSGEIGLLVFFGRDDPTGFARGEAMEMVASRLESSGILALEPTRPVISPLVINRARQIVLRAFLKV